MRIFMEEKEYLKTGTRWMLIDEKDEEISREFYENMTDEKTSRFFRNLGGYERRVMNHTPDGYHVTALTSINPDGKTKIFRHFVFVK